MPFTRRLLLVAPTLCLPWVAARAQTKAPQLTKETETALFALAAQVAKSIHGLGIAFRWEAKGYTFAAEDHPKDFNGILHGFEARPKTRPALEIKMGLHVDDFGQTNVSLIFTKRVAKGRPEVALLVHKMVFGADGVLNDTYVVKNHPRPTPNGTAVLSRMAPNLSGKHPLFLYETRAPLKRGGPDVVTRALIFNSDTQTYHITSRDARGQEQKTAINGGLGGPVLQDYQELWGLYHTLPHVLRAEGAKIGLLPPLPTPPAPSERITSTEVIPT